MPKAKFKITQNQAIFGVLGLIALGVIIMNVTGTTDKDIGLGGDDVV
jgi:hypothetical protein